MSLNKNIFDRLSLKKITLNKQNKISEQLSSESEKMLALLKNKGFAEQKKSR